METNSGTSHPECKRFANLKLAFSMAMHSLLTACPREEFKSHFSCLLPYQQDALHKLFQQMLMSVQENVQEEFADICEETRVLDVLDDEGLLRQHLDTKDIRTRVTTAGRKMIINEKRNELEYLKKTLASLKEQNSASSLKLKSLKEDTEASDSINSIDTIMGKLKELNGSLGSAMPRPKMWN